MKKEGNIKDLAENQVVSRMLDNILPLSSSADILSIMDSFSEDFRIICCDAFASHVMQTVLIEGFKRCQVRMNCSKNVVHFLLRNYCEEVIREEKCCTVYQWFNIHLIIIYNVCTCM